MVLTKENSFFVVVALGGLLILNRWFHFGTVTPRLWILTFVGPLAGFVGLILLTGGIDVFMGMQKLQLAKIKTTGVGGEQWRRSMVPLPGRFPPWRARW